MAEMMPLDALRQRRSDKWSTHADDVLPMFIAEMDVALAPAIREALQHALDLGDTGYVNPHDTGAAEAFADYAADAWGWSPSPERMAMTTDVSVVIVESLRRLIAPGDGVIINPPVYPPFTTLIPEAGGTVVEVPLLDDGERFALDLDGIDRALAAGARAVLLCNPHNPVGLVHSRETLEQVANIVAKHDAVVVSDEIHAPLTHHGVAFTPYLSVSDAARDHGIAAESGSKAFNLAGLKCALFVTDSERMARLVRELPEDVVFRAGLFGALATQAGFASSRDWLDAAITLIEGNFTLLRAELAAKLPQVHCRAAEASYVAWLDMTALGWGDDPAAVALDRARVALSNGPEFGAPGRGFARMNLACAPEVIVEAVDRMARAYGAGAAWIADPLGGMRRASGPVPAYREGMNADPSATNAAATGRRFFACVPRRDADAAAALVTPESRERWGDFSAFFDLVLAIERPAVASDADHVVDAPDVAYLRLLENAGGGPGLSARQSQVGVVGVLTLVWRPEAGSWLAHDFGVQVPAAEVPRTSPGVAPELPETEHRPWLR